ncbi:MAG: alanine racemase [Flavobacteriales bacterium]|nr:MAG: alanine racemase [Flavobacteriales bacterium]
MNGTSKIEISEKALNANYTFIRRLLGKKQTILSSVVKGNAYGHGIEIFVPLAERCGVNHFSVFSDDEAYRVYHSSKKNSGIMIMGQIAPSNFDWVIAHDVSFFCFSKERLEKAISIAKQLNKKAKIHIEVETGLNRTGFSISELPGILEIVKAHLEHLEVVGLCSHLAGAESIGNYLRIKKQRQNFKKADQLLIENGFKGYLKHLACSAALVRYPDTRYDLVRVGIMQYGFWPSPEIFIEYCGAKSLKTSPLKRVISWKTQIMDIKNVKTGEYIGYGNSFMAHKNMRIATLPVGYSHGFFRSLSNKGRVLVHGERVPVIGTVNMNGTTIDISDISKAQAGDEAVLIGYQNDQEITVASFGEFSNQLNYELLTRLPEHLPRHIVN